jgi:hypothetical protein
MEKFKRRDNKKYESIAEFEECLYHFALNDFVSLEISLKTLGLSMEKFEGIAYKILTSKTSSDDRERIVVRFIGFTPKDSSVKHGFDGFNDANEPAEIKASNSPFIAKKKMTFVYNINDYTQKRLAKDIRLNPHYALAGFIDGQLIYVATFRFNDSDKLAQSLAQQMDTVLENIIEDDENKRTVGRITLENIPLETLKIHLAIPKNDLVELQHCFNKNLFNILMKSAIYGSGAKYVNEIADIEDLFE